MTAATTNERVDGMAYLLTLTDDEYRALAWVADRYVSAEVLFDGMQATDVDGVYAIPEHVAWDYDRALDEDEDGSPLVPPCIGGPLAEKLIALRGSIV